MGSPSPFDATAEVLAAVDLGSNSFHMIVGELRHGQIVILDRLRETVRLAEGLTSDGDLSVDARARAVTCLERFGERLRDMHADSVRAAGTSTLRRSREDTGFLAEAEHALGHPIDVISGMEEARLIYAGVNHSLPPTDGFRLVMDIGGGSTELILGQGDRPQALKSLHLGCVAMTERFFPGGAITADAFTAARQAARLELRPVKAFFRDVGAVEAIGASGTIRSTERVATALQLTDTSTLTAEAVEQLIVKVLDHGNTSELALSGLSERRAQVWPGGLAILAELMAVLRIEALKISEGALKEGLLHDMLGRLQQEDARERSVRAMVARYQVDEAQAQRVAAMATDLYGQCREVWGIEDPLFAKALEWAARLHEIGLDISHNGYQRHGAYIAEHADMPGFPRAEKRLVAYLIDAQRHQLNKRLVAALPFEWREPASRLAILLRLSVLLNRSRSTVPIPPIALRVDDSRLQLTFDQAWLAQNPLTIADLQREQAFLEGLSFELSFG